MKEKKPLTVYATIALLVSLPFTFIHLAAKPDDSPITALQHVVAAIANFFGPWGVLLVRLVDFPNAGLRAFSWSWAITLTFAGAALLFVVPWARQRCWRILVSTVWALFVVLWFGVGLTQIASGLL